MLVVYHNVNYTPIHEFVLFYLYIDKLISDSLFLQEKESSVQNVWLVVTLIVLPAVRAIRAMSHRPHRTASSLEYLHVTNSTPMIMASHKIKYSLTTQETFLS
jgi:hypothetical protein